MADDRERRPRPGRGFGRRLVWFVLLWAAGVAAVGAVAYAIRFWLAL